MLAVRISAPDKTWKFDARRDVGIYLGDADDTKRECLVYMLATGVVRIRSDCVRLNVGDEKLLFSFDSRTRLQERTSPVQKVRDAKDTLWRILLLRHCNFPVRR